MSAAVEPSTCVAHLVWAPLGPRVLEQFIDAYLRRDAGSPHRLLFVLNGFQPGDDLEPWQRQLSRVEHEQLLLERPVFDLAAYRAAAEHGGAARYCFLNSYSEPLVDGWLTKLEGALAQPSVGLVGATGSWASISSRMAHYLYLPSAYRGALPPRSEAFRQFIELDVSLRDVEMPSKARPLRSRLLDKLKAVPEIPRQTFPYRRFPAYHMRTNGFLLSRETMFSLDWLPLETKHDTYMIEHGRRNITWQLHRRGLRTLVVDRDGIAYDREQWDRSRTLWQGDQEGLLIADNQTRCYADADLERRRLLAAFAWGRAAHATRGPAAARVSVSRP